MTSPVSLTASEQAQLAQTIDMFEVIAQSQPQDYQSLEILREAYYKLGREQDLINTSKRIAKAYVQMGQLSSAILEYESILQRYPDDEETRSALEEIESQATSLSQQEDVTEMATSHTAFIRQRPEFRSQPQANIDDGRKGMFKVFVDGKIISSHDFDSCWMDQDWGIAPREPVLPFIQALAERDLVSLDQSLKLVADRSRLAYLPIEKYEVDIEMARTFPSETCLRWCVLPFDRMSKSVMVATANPFNRQVITELEEVSHQRLLWYLAPPREIMLALKKCFR